MFTSIERLIASRNLRPKKKEGILKVISVFSFIGIMLGVAVLIIVMSVMNGFRTDLTNKILGFNAHLIIEPYKDTIIDKKYKKKLIKDFENLDIYESYDGEAVIMKNQSAKGVLVKGLDKKNKKTRLF